MFRMSSVKVLRLSLLLAGLMSVAGGAAASPTGLIETFDPTTLQMTNQGFTTSSVASKIAFYNNEIYAVLPGGTLAAYNLNGSQVLNLQGDGFADIASSDGNLNGSLSFGFGNMAGQFLSIVSNGFTISPPAITPTLAKSVTTLNGNTWTVLADGTLAEYDGNGNLLVSYSFAAFAAVTSGNGNLYGSVNAGIGNWIGRVFDVVNNGFIIDPPIVTPELATSIVIGNGDIYAAFGNGTIDRFDTAGNLLASVSVPGAQYLDLTYGNGELFATRVAPVPVPKPVPEPASGIFVIAGLSGLLLWARRRKGAVEPIRA